MRWLISAIGYVFLTCASLAQVGQIPIYAPIVSGGGSPATINPVFANAQDIAFGSGTYTSPSETWTANPAICGIYDDAAVTWTSVTINSVTASQIGSYSGTGKKGSLWIATGLSSGSGTVQAVGPAFSLGVVTAQCVQITTTTTTPTANFETDFPNNAQPAVFGAMTIPTNGVGVWFAASIGTTASPFPCIWNATAGTAPSRQTTLESNVTTHNGGITCGGTSNTAGSATAEVSLTTGSFSFINTSGAMLFAAWGP